MLKIYIVALFYLLTSTIAHCDPIKLIGISMNMSEDQVKSELGNRGYSCSEETNFYGVVEDKCRSDKAEKMVVHLGIEQGLINFDCGNFNICDFTLNEVADSLIESGIINKLEYTIDLNNGDFNENFIEKYCGRGTDGDVLCAIKIENDLTQLVGKPVIYLQLQKGALGSNGPSFE